MTAIRVIHTGTEVYVVTAGANVSVTMTRAAEVQDLNDLRVAGLKARGYQTHLEFTLNAPLGFCSSGSHTMTEIEYVADVPDPQVSPAAALQERELARAACLPADAGSHREPGRLVVFRSISLTGGGHYGDIVAVLERANVHRFDANDISLFSVPTDFKEIP